MKFNHRILVEKLDNEGEKDVLENQTLVSRKGMVFEILWDLAVSYLAL